MNELAGVSPKCFTTSNELRLFLAGYGPHVGKYVLAYPDFSKWKGLILDHYRNAGDIERERIKSAFTNAVRSAAFIEKRSIPWDDNIEWSGNILNAQNESTHFSRIFFSDEEYEALLIEMQDIEQYKILPISEPEIAGSTDELIETSPTAYLNSISILFSISFDIHVIDPYFNPLRRDRRDIYLDFIKKICASNRPIMFKFWVRADQMSDSMGRFDAGLLLDLTAGKIRTNHPDTSVEFILLNDDQSVDKLHARYFLTEKGGIKFDQGFQKLPAGRRNIASPIGKKLHETIYEKFTKETFSKVIQKKIKIL